MTLSPDLQLPESWRAALAAELTAPYMAELRQFLLAEKNAGKSIFPTEVNWFRALYLTPLDKVRVVILGQDPYHGEGQAHGIGFSVPPGVRTPPSLVNIFKELESDLGIARPAHGFLEHWARQGVLLLNAVLTVEMGRAGSHRKRGWEEFTDAVIGAVNKRAEPSVFMLWGNYAQQKASLLDADRHLVLTAPHPSPLSAYGGFFGCRHFSQANAFLEKHGRGAIDWALPDCDPAA
jgi:uracil-DNA glycosylase